MSSFFEIFCGPWNNSQVETSYHSPLTDSLRSGPTLEIFSPAPPLLHAKAYCQIEFFSNVP